MSVAGQGTGTRPDPLFVELPTQISFTPLPLKATWKYKVGNDGLKNQYETAEISCTFRQKRKRVTDIRGNHVMSSAVMRTTADVQPDDVIIYKDKAWPVITVDDVHDINNTVIEKIVYL